MSGPDPEHRRQIRLGGLDPREDSLGVLDQLGSRRGRSDAAAVAHDQRRAGLGLEPSDRLRDRGLRVRQRLSRRRERPAAHHLGQDPQRDRRAALAKLINGMINFISADSR